MIYIIQGQEEIFIRNKIKELSSQQNCELTDLNGSDKDFSIDLMISSCTGNSLFNDKNVVLVKDPYFLIKKIDDKELEQLSQYIKNPLYETDLVLYTYENKFLTRLKAYKTISENAQVINFNGYDYKNFNLYVSEELKKTNLKIDRNCFNLLCDLCRYDATLLNQNLEVLKLYPGPINEDVINHLCTVKENTQSFDLINAIIDKNVTKSIALEREMIKDSNSVLGIISLIAGQLRFLYQVSFYKDKGYGTIKIADLLNAKEFRIKHCFDTLRNLDKETILYYLDQLSRFDIQCKTNSDLGDNTSFELFLLQLMNYGKK